MSYKYVTISSPDDLLEDAVYYVITGGRASDPSRFIGFDGDRAKFESLYGNRAFNVNKNTARFDARIYEDTDLPVYAPRPGRERSSTTRATPASNLVPTPYQQLPVYNIPRGATNAITTNDISNGDIMVNFHGERTLSNPRYYKRTTVTKLTPRINPFSRKPIKSENITLYKARVTGGKRKTRKQRAGSNQEARLENVLGITAAQGYNKEVLAQASSLSKNTRSNYLTQLRKEKKFREYFKGTPPEDWLGYAVVRGDTYVIKRLLENPPPALKRAMEDKEAFYAKSYNNKYKANRLSLLEFTIEWLSGLERDKTASDREKNDVLQFAVEFAKHTNDLFEDTYFELYDLPIYSIKRIVQANPTLLELVKSNLMEMLEGLASQNRGIEERMAQFRAQGLSREANSLQKVYQEQKEFYDKQRSILKAIDPEYYRTSPFANNINLNNYSNTLRQMYGNMNM